MKEIIFIFSLFFEDEVNPDDDNFGEVAGWAFENQINNGGWNWAKANYVVVPDDIGDDEGYELVRKKYTA